MKTLLMLLLTISIANAQNNDPTYSIHNYKHPNKAAKARTIKKEGVDNESYKIEASTSQRNYKSQFNQGSNRSGAIMPIKDEKTNVNALSSNRNYKSQFGKR